MARQIILDTETTGLNANTGDRIIEIGCVEVVSRRLTGNHYHQYIQPDREVPQDAIEIHGITNEFLVDKPRFEVIAQEFMDFIRGAELVIHNAAFDVGFINMELARLGPQWGQVADHCTVLDTLMLAREMHPGQRNTLDALCKRYDIDNSSRTLHGALLDSEILADVYLAMTGGQTALLLDMDGEDGNVSDGSGEESARIVADRPALRVLTPTAEELTAHQTYMEMVAKSAGGESLWQKLESSSE